MIRHTTIATAEPETEDRSMRVIEYALALVALVTAGVLAFLR
jgi:hypothetical protein